MNEFYPFFYLSVQELRVKREEVYLRLLEATKACYDFEDLEAVLTEEKIEQLKTPLYEYRDLMRKQYNDLSYALRRALS